MDYFSEIPEGQAIVCANYVYCQVKIATRGGRLYAKHGRGYVLLRQGGTSSHPKVRWYQIDPGDGSFSEKRGYVLYAEPTRKSA